ncbi:MAG: hypothetical protein QOJ16_4630, partial [Acidobacteriota bacterium]|nr:hypothetical protein [Acidobacteriota bacterium]
MKASEIPDSHAYTFLADGEGEGASLTYAQLDARARALAAVLAERGLRGERALLLFPPGLDFILAFWGCLYAGVVAVPAYPPKERAGQLDSRLLAILADARPRAVLTTAAVRARLEGLSARLPGLADLAWFAADEVPDAAAEGFRDPRLAPADLAFLQYTSGSTALPKGVMVSHGNLRHNEEMIRQAFGQSAESVIVGWLPLYHDMGLIGNVLQPLYLGARCILMSPLAFLQRPRRWLAAISRYRATTSGGPNFAFDLCVRKIPPEARAGLDLGSWTLAFNGAEPVRAETLERFAAAFAPCGFRRSAFYPCYGLAEATLFAAGGAPGRGPVARSFDRAELERNRAAPAAPEEGAALVACGGPWLGQRLAIADPESGALRPAGQVGEIWLSGPSVAAGYWGRPEESEETFRARLAGDPDGVPFLRTGDLGFVDGDTGELFVAGRLKDLIILRGRNLYPQDVERVAEQSFPGLRPGSSAAFAVEVAGVDGVEERLVVVLELDRHAAQGPAGPVVDAVRAAVAARLEAQIHEVVLVRAGAVPKTSSGKIQRRATRAAYLAGRLEAVARSAVGGEGGEGGEAALTRAGLLALEPEARFPALLRDLRGRAARAARMAAAGLSPDLPLSGLDSLAALELRNAIERDLGVDLPLATLLAAPTPRRLAAEVLAGLSSPATGEEEPEPLRAAASPPTEFPLSYGQRALWYLDRLAPEAGAYIVAAAARVSGGLDPAALGRALQGLADRHPVLRTTFAAVNGEPRQRVHPAIAIDLAQVDASGWSEERLSARLHEEAFRPFDLERGPLLRARVCTRGPEGGEPVVLLAVHHLVTDFWSLALALHELDALYRAAAGPAGLAEPPPPPPALAYSDYVDWESRRLAGPAGERLWDYWRERLAGELPDLALTPDRPRPPVQTHRGGSATLRLDAEVADRLRQRAHRGAGAGEEGGGATLFALLLAAFQALLYRHTGQVDFAVGAPVAGRARAALTDLPGYLVNAVVLRADLTGEPTFAEHLERTGRSVAAALAHQDLPFALLAERLRPLRDPGRSPLFQAFFTLQRSPLPGGESLAALALGAPGRTVDLAGLTLTPLPLDRRPAQFDLALETADLDGPLAAVLRYNADLFDSATAERLLGRFARLLAAAAQLPETPVTELPLLSEAERRELLVDWNATDRPLASGVCLHTLFEEQARRTPEAPAVEMAGVRGLTYGELDARADRLARRLRRLGVGPEVPVGLHLERSPGMVVALLGVLKAGGAYLPLDPSYPEERLAYMLEDSGVGVVLTGERLALPASFRGTALDALAALEEAGEGGELP